MVPLTVLGAGLVTCALLTLISPDGAEAPAGYLVDGFLGDARTVGPDEPELECICRTLCWQADQAPLSWLPESTESAAA